MLSRLRPAEQLRCMVHTISDCNRGQESLLLGPILLRDRGPRRRLVVDTAASRSAFVSKKIPLVRVRSRAWGIFFRSFALSCGQSLARTAVQHLGGIGLRFHLHPAEPPVL